MSRRRYLSSTVVTDRRINQMGMKYGDGPVLFYTWLIPCCDDDGTITADPWELLGIVWGGRRDKTNEDVEQALAAGIEFGLFALSSDGQRLQMPVEAWYRYQSYIPSAKRRSVPQNAEEPRKPAETTDEQRESAQTSASPSPSPSPSPSGEAPPPAARVREGDAPAPTAAQRIEAAWFTYAGGPISPTALGDLTAYLTPDEGLGTPAVTVDVIELALRAAHDNGQAGKLSYVKGVLKGAVARGAVTAERWQAAEAVRERTKTNGAARASPANGSAAGSAGPTRGDDVAHYLRLAKEKARKAREGEALP